MRDFPDKASNYLLDAKLIESCDGELAKEYLRNCNMLNECGWSQNDFKRLKKESPKTFARIYELMLTECDCSQISINDMATIRYSFTHPKQPIEAMIDILIH